MDAEVKKQIIIAIFVLALAIPVGWFFWKLERKINWKYSYGKEFQKLEKRIEIIERKLGVENEE